MPRLVLARSESGEFGLDYITSSGRVTAVYCTDPRGLSGTVVLDGGQTVTQALSAGQTMSVPGNKVKVALVTDDEGNPSYDLVGLISLSFQWGK